MPISTDTLAEIARQERPALLPVDLVVHASTDSEFDFPIPIFIRSYSDSLKRSLDLALLVVLAPAWIPVFAITSVLVFVANSGNVYFAHSRFGRHGRKIKVLKFRTMKTDAEECLQDVLENDPALAAEWQQHGKLKNDPRVTWMGKILRATSLDELPQVVNVLKGEMSLVGPRPLPEYHLEEAPFEYVDARHRVQPGLTGLWQIKARDGELGQLIRYDVDYLARQGLLEDMRIICLTFVSLVLRRGS